MKKQLDERKAPFAFSCEVLQEALKTDGGYRPMVLRGKCQEGDKPNGNRRVYPDELWEGVVHDEGLQKRIASRAVIMELDHPNDGETRLERGAAVLTRLWKENKEVFLEAEVLDTPRGALLQEYARKKVQIGVSSRSTGDVVLRDGLEYVKPEGFDFETFDFVYRQSVADAIPALVERTITHKPNKEEDMAKDARMLFKEAESEARTIFGINPKKVDPKAMPVICEQILDIQSDIHGLREIDPSLVPAIDTLSARLEESRVKLLDQEFPPEEEEKPEVPEAEVVPPKPAPVPPVEEEEKPEIPMEEEDEDPELPEGCEGDKMEAKKWESKLSKMDTKQLVKTILEMRQRYLARSAQYTTALNRASGIIEKLKTEAAKADSYAKVIEEMVGRIKSVVKKGTVPITEFLGKPKAGKPLAEAVPPTPPAPPVEEEEDDLLTSLIAGPEAEDKPVDEEENLELEPVEEEDDTLAIPQSEGMVAARDRSLRNLKESMNGPRGVELALKSVAMRGGR